MNSRSKQLAPARRVLERLASGLWIVFWIGTLIVLAAWLSGFEDAELQRAISNSGLRNALSHGLAVLDVSWVTLAAANVYLATAAAESLAAARRWALLTLLCSGLIAWASATTGWPLGPIQYSDRLGAQIGPVPFGLPLLWFTIAAGARCLVLCLWPAFSHRHASFSAGLLIVLTAVNLEPVAWKERAFWAWYPCEMAPPSGAPLQNYLTWLVLGTALVYAMRPSRVIPDPAALPRRPAITFVVLNAVLLATHLVRWWRPG